MYLNSSVVVSYVVVLLIYNLRLSFSEGIEAMMRSTGIASLICVKSVMVFFRCYERQPIDAFFQRGGRR